MCDSVNNGTIVCLNKGYFLYSCRFCKNMSSKSKWKQKLCDIRNKQNIREDKDKKNVAWLCLP